MKVSRELVIGRNKYNIEFEVSTETEFVKFSSFLDSLPTTGPNGETDLMFSYRTPKDYEYYSIICPSAKQEFRFGQYRDSKGRLFAKGWEPMYNPNETSESEDSQSLASSGLGGLGQPTPTPTPAPTASKSNSRAKQQANAPVEVQNKANDILSKFGLN